MRYTCKERENLLKELTRSGLSVSAFSAKRGISIATLSRWRRQAASALKGNFIELRDESTWYEIISDGVVLKVPIGASPKKLSEIIRELRC